MFTPLRLDGLPRLFNGLLGAQRLFPGFVGDGFCGFPLALFSLEGASGGQKPLVQVLEGGLGTFVYSLLLLEDRLKVLDLCPCLLESELCQCGPLLEEVISGHEEVPLTVGPELFLHGIEHFSFGLVRGFSFSGSLGG